MENEQATQPQKLEIEKSFKEKLKLYLFIVRPDNILPHPNERLAGIIGYRIEDAIVRAKQDHAKPGMGIIYTGDFIYIKDLIKLVGKEATTIQKEPILEKEPFLKEFIPVTNREQFIWNLNLLNDYYIENEEDRENVKKAIKNLNEPAKR